MYKGKKAQSKDYVLAKGFFKFMGCPPTVVLGASRLYFS
jgi:hypothetical protein